MKKYAITYFYITCHNKGLKIVLCFPVPSSFLNTDKQITSHDMMTFNISLLTRCSFEISAYDSTRHFTTTCHVGCYTMMWMCNTCLNGPKYSCRGMRKEIEVLVYWCMHIYGLRLHIFFLLSFSISVTISQMQLNT